MTVIEIATKKLKDLTLAQEDIQLAIDETEVAIENYCNIDEVPEALNFTWANMATDLARYTYAKTTSENDILAGIDISDVSNLKMGDTQIALQGGSGSRHSALKSHRPNLDEIVFNYKEQLNKFRRLVW